MLTLLQNVFSAAYFSSGGQLTPFPPIKLLDNQLGDFQFPRVYLCLLKFACTPNLNVFLKGL